MTKSELQEYGAIKREREHLLERLEEMSAMYYPGAQALTGMPAAHSEDNAMERVLIQKASLLESYRQTVDQLERKMREVEEAIASLDSPEREIIRCRYIDCMPWEKVCVKTNYSWRSVHRIHARALRKLEEK